MKRTYLSRVIIGGLVMVTWFSLVWTGRTDVAGFVDALKTILLSVGVYHATLAKGQE